MVRRCRGIFRCNVVLSALFRVILRASGKGHVDSVRCIISWKYILHSPTILLLRIVGRGDKKAIWW